MCIANDSDYQARLINALKRNEYLDALGQISEKKSDKEVLSFLMNEAMPILNERLEYLYGMSRVKGSEFDGGVIDREQKEIMKIIERICQDNFITVLDCEKKQFERELVEGVDEKYKSFLK